MSSRRRTVRAARTFAVEIAQQLVDQDRPGLLAVGVLLAHAEQFAQVIDVAEGVPGLAVAAVGLVAVRDGDAGEVGQHAGVIKARAAALGV